jgi:hypothetical protein
MPFKNGVKGVMKTNSRDRIDIEVWDVDLRKAIMFEAFTQLS